MNIIDSSQADPTASGEQMYFRHWIRLLGSAGKIQDTRVGSFNTGSGAYLAAITAATTIFSGMPFEIHGLVSPDEKDRALDRAIENIRIQQEVPMWTVEQNQVYSLGPEIKDVLELCYFANPLSSLNVSEHKVDWWKFVTTATGQSLRIAPALSQSQQLIIDALLEVSLGAGDLATVNLLSDDMILWNATARVYWLLEQRSPAQDAAKYKDKRREAAHEYTRLASRFAPVIYRRIQLDERY